jgi:hypothetical protein
MSLITHFGDGDGEMAFVEWYAILMASVLRSDCLASTVAASLLIHFFRSRDSAGLQASSSKVLSVRVVMAAPRCVG